MKGYAVVCSNPIMQATKLHTQKRQREDPITANTLLPLLKRWQELSICEGVQRQD